MTPDDNPELSSYDAGKRHGITQTLEHPALADISLELVLARAAIAVLTNTIAERDRTIRAYRSIIRG